MIGKKKVATGAPEWVLTYGDMMSLLLCFFILLAAFADYQAGGGGSENIMAAMQSIQKALGIRPANPSGLDKVVQFNTMVEEVMQAIKEFETRNRGNSPDQGVQGKSFRLARIRDGMEISIGGIILFEPFSPEMTGEGRRALGDIFKALKGHRNKIEIIGHASERPTPADWTYLDSLELSYNRAKAVGKELVARGLDPRTVRLVAAGANEPIRKTGDAFARPGDDRRVEVVVRESVIDDYSPERPAQAPASALPTPPPEAQPQ